MPGCLSLICFIVYISYVGKFSRLMVDTHSDLFSTSHSGKLNILTWNASGIMSGSVYLSNILDQTDVDICGVSGHWLYNNNLYFLQSINSKYKCFAISDADLLKPSRRKVGKGGVA